MLEDAASEELLDLLNQAIARELQVSIQYMFQHAIEAAQSPRSAQSSRSAREPGEAKKSKFIGSHAAYWLPGQTLKKIAIAEMRHAEAIAERVVALGGRPTTQPAPVTIGDTAQEMLDLDREQERQAVSLYGRIIGLARREGDLTTMALFKRIITDERGHQRTFEGLLEDGGQPRPSRWGSVGSRAGQRGGR